MCDEKRISDTYEAAFSDYWELASEVCMMESNSVWYGGLSSNQLRLEPIIPIEITDISYRTGLDREILFETVEDGTKLVVGNSEASFWPVRECGRNSLYSTAKLWGTALGRMGEVRLAECLNDALSVASGGTLLLERYGKASAFHSMSGGGYDIMPISELMEKTKHSLETNFGSIEFAGGYNSHSYTDCRWRLPERQDEILDVYQSALQNAPNRQYAANFMPAAHFSSSDTGISCARLLPEFEIRPGLFFRMGDGVSVKHEKSSGGIAKYEEEIDLLYAKFQAIGKQVADLASIEVRHPENMVIGFCKRLAIPKKYGEAARERIEQFTFSSAVLNGHDVYLAMTEAIGAAMDYGANQNVISQLEDSVAKLLKMDWSSFDVGGTVLW